MVSFAYRALLSPLTDFHVGKTGLELWRGELLANFRLGPLAFLLDKTGLKKAPRGLFLMQYYQR